jgi:probable rRNA maturation factor
MLTRRFVVYWSGKRRMTPIYVEVCLQDCWQDEALTKVNEAATNPDAISSETWSLWFQKWLETLQPTFSSIATYELSLRLTGDSEIRILNAQYRQQDKPTDVLAFAALETDSPELEELQELPVYLGDIVISVETAQRQAYTQGHSLKIELAWLASHGLLHLLGWDHPDEPSLLQMLSEQQNLLHTVGLWVGGG